MNKEKLWISKANIFKLLILIVLTWLILVFTGPSIDKLCVIGRLSKHQANAISELKWNKCPKYSDCVAEENDRVLNKQCSDLLAWLTLRN